MPERNRGAYDARRAFDAAGAFLRGHFVYTSGRHGADYLEKFRILEDPKATRALAAMIAEEFRRLTPELVAGPTTGGIILAYEVARQLGINAVYVPGRRRGHRHRCPRGSNGWSGSDECAVLCLFDGRFPLLSAGCVPRLRCRGSAGRSARKEQESSGLVLLDPGGSRGRRTVQLLAHLA